MYMIYNREIDNFQKKMDRFIEDFYRSKEYLNLKEANKKLYDSMEMKKYNKQKEALEQEINLVANDKEKFTKEYLAEINERFLKLKESISTLECVKKYEKAYSELEKVRNVFNRELLRKLYL